MARCLGLLAVLAALVFASAAPACSPACVCVRPGHGYARVRILRPVAPVTIQLGAPPAATVVVPPVAAPVVPVLPLVAPARVKIIVK